ncbi:MAG: methyltransferase domain-containing protein [Thermogemmatispora sp.]|uniref:SAM-dependent methyltransferase n=1 Tax=Thermogemmatispora sp. TaxID=1968838 RepID=UPI002638FB38|nr:SAM-dependent methyltransferase [Thermogemmatispora sp.]MBX5457117.1 methyltransferase domain-containing protein [Thermogemmatispora sp.]
MKITLYGANDNNAERVIATAQPEFLQPALAELQSLCRALTVEEELAPGIALCTVPERRRFLRQAMEQMPIFVRHLAPAQAIVELSGTIEDDCARLALALAALPEFAWLGPGQRFAVQARLLPPAMQPPVRSLAYTSGQINQRLASVISEETGAIESIRKPRIVLSIALTAERGFVGISLAEENLSSWPGGERHFARLPEQISRAELKLLEALEVFSLTLPTEGEALDLGAAPGGWTRLLLQAGLHVVAVDPAALAPALREEASSHLEHRRCSAEVYLAEALHQSRRFAVITNDMRMDARDAARLLVRAAELLRDDGFVLSVLKLPHVTKRIQPLPVLREALGILQRTYAIVKARQLFHNRQEVTVVAASPRQSRPFAGRRPSRAGA